MDKFFGGKFLLKEEISNTEYSQLFRALCIGEDGRERDAPDYAVKVVDRGREGERMPLSFSLPSLEREMQISGQIAGDTQSEVSVPILWIGHEEENGKNVDYGVMQYKSGGLFLTEMERLLRGKYSGAGKIPISVVCGITIRILISLRSLHSSLRSRDPSFSGHLHLDLHPGNIFLENASLEDPGGGFVKFIDFQNARQMNEHFRAKNDPPLPGYTPAFTAPEIERILMVPGTEREGLSQLKKSIRFSRESLYELLSLSYQMFIPAAFISWECLLAEEGKMKPETRGEKVKRGQTFLSRRSGSFGRIPEGMRLTGNGSGISTRDLRSSGSF